MIHLWGKVDQVHFMLNLSISWNPSLLPTHKVLETFLLLPSRTSVVKHSVVDSPSFFNISHCMLNWTASKEVAQDLYMTSMRCRDHVSISYERMY